MRHDLEALVAEVHARAEVAVVEGQVGLVAQELRGLVVARRRDGDDRMPVLVLEREDVVPELCSKTRLDLRRWQRAW